MKTTRMHRLLIRQLRKFGPAGEDIPEEWQELFDAINEAYDASDEDRRLMEKSMEISSREMHQAYKDLSGKEAALREALEQLQRANRELRETQGQLIQKEKLASIGQLAAGVAHEINNPLSFVSANVQMLERYLTAFTRIFDFLDEHQRLDPDDAQAVQSYLTGLQSLSEEVSLAKILPDISLLLEETNDGLQRVKQIVNDLRTFAREDRGEPTLVRLDQIIERALTIAANEVKYKADVVRDFAGDLPDVRCSEQRLSQVFINLIVNAAQAMDERGTIAVRTYQQAGHVCAEVSDTGHGIPEENLQKIFDPFFTTKPVGSGTGLGLSVCHEIIKNHHGEIRVRSEVDKGTTFLVRLPAGTIAKTTVGPAARGDAR